jgi:predicted PurR-regulated permease PerM
VITSLLIAGAAVTLGVPNPLILGLFSGVLQLIPNIGPLLAIIPAAFLALVSQSTTFPVLEGGGFALVVMIVWVVIQNLILFVLVPRIMGRGLHLHPFIVLVAVVAGATVAGALGLLLSVPFAASARILAYYLYGKLTDQEPFPDRLAVRPAGPPLWRRGWGWLTQQLPAQVREMASNDQPVNTLIMKIRRSDKHE